MRGGGQRDLEFARQKREFGMHGQMLAQHLGPDARILDLVGGDAGPLVGGDIAHAIAAGLHAVQADAGEIGHGVGQLLEFDPVELDVLPRGEMAEIAVVAPRHVRQHAHLRGRQRAVGNGDAQHVGVQLQIDSVHQPQRPEFVLGQFAGQPAPDLIAKLGDALSHQRAVEFVVEIHACLAVRTRCALRCASRRWVRSSGSPRASFRAALARPPRP